MEFDEYRGKLLERLWACKDTVAARSLLAEANLVLVNSRMNRMTQDRFWETLEEELEAVGKDAKVLTDRNAAATLEAVVAAARARIARYRAQDEGDAPSSGKGE